MKNIGIVHGGTSNSRTESLQYGKQVKKILENLGMSVLDIHLHPNGSWTVNGEVKNIEESLKKVDSVWNCLVGSDGESGLVEKLCTECKVKLVGHTIFHSDLANDKKNLLFALNQHGIKTPYGKVIQKKNFSKENLLSIFSSVGIPCIVKPLHGSDHVGISIVNNFPELEQAVENLLMQNQDVLVEKIITGTPISCFVFEHNNLIHTNIKTFGETGLSREEIIKIRNEALYIHNCLAFPHHTEYDFILSPKGIYFIEANTHPSLCHGYIKDSFKESVGGLSEYIRQKVS